MAGIRGIEIDGIQISVEGLAELQAQFDSLGKIPTASLVKAAKAGLAAPLALSKATAPVGETGMLKRGIHAIRETPNKRKKAVYRVFWWAKYSDFYRKPTSGIYGGQTPNAYYPQSVEWGYPTAKGHKEGRYFVKNAIVATQSGSLQKIIDTLNSELDKLL